MNKYLKTLKVSLLILFGVSIFNNVSAVEWSSSNVQLIQGSGYELGKEERTIFTFEHSNKWQYGDNFFFLDVIEPSGSGTTHYAEFSPRLSLRKLTGKDISTGIIQDVFLAGTIEMGEDLHTHLLGIGTSLDVANFSYLNINLYWRKSYRDWVTDNTDLGGQVNINWGLPFTIASSKWIFEGHLDYSFREGGGTNPKDDNLNAAPRLLLDVGNFWNTQGHLMAGIEYQVWRNKFGVDGVNEDVAQLMFKWIF